MSDPPVTRGELERALRRLATSIELVRDDVQRLAARVVALGGELGRDDAELEARVDVREPAALEEIRAADEDSTERLRLGFAVDKYAVEPRGPDCRSILPICQGRCCRLRFALSTQDLDEGVIRWDYGRPYLIKHRPEDDRCVHSHPTGHHCTVYQHRPVPCRRYDCRDDPRIWADFEQRILAHPDALYGVTTGLPEPDYIDLHDRIRLRQVALTMESWSVEGSPPPGEPEPDGSGRQR